MLGAEKLASTRRTFLSKCFASETAVSSARVVLPTPPLIDTNARMFVIFRRNQGSLQVASFELVRSFYHLKLMTLLWYIRLMLGCDEFV